MFYKTRVRSALKDLGVGAEIVAGTHNAVFDALTDGCNQIGLSPQEAAINVILQFDGAFGIGAFISTAAPDNVIVSWVSSAKVRLPHLVYILALHPDGHTLMINVDYCIVSSSAIREMREGRPEVMEAARSARTKRAKGHTRRYSIC